MKIFTGIFSDYCCGESSYIAVVIVANTKTEALGFALGANQDTNADKWEITEVDTTEAACHEVLRVGS